MDKKPIPRKRNGYYYREGDLEHPYVSVTKVLGDVLNKPALIYWMAASRCKGYGAQRNTAGQNESRNKSSWARWLERVNDM